MMRARAMLMILLLTFGAFAVTAQETPAYVSDLTPLLIQYGLSAEQIEAFENGAGELDWSDATDIDPLVFEFVFEYGLSQEGWPIDLPLVFAHTMAQQIARMTQMGLDNRQIARACTEATREAVRLMQQDQAQMGGNGTDLGEMLRTRLMNAAEEQMLRIAARVRNSTSSGNTNRVGEDEPGVPPEEKPGDGTPSGPNH